VALPADEANAPEDIAAAQPASAELKLEIRAAGKKPKFQQFPLQQGMCIQDALEQSGLTRRFRRMDVKLVRSTAEGSAKLDSKYDHKANRVDPLYDYALYNGDHLIVIEDTSTVLDDLVNALPNLGPRRSR